MDAFFCKLLLIAALSSSVSSAQVDKSIAAKSPRQLKLQSAIGKSKVRVLVSNLEKFYEWSEQLESPPKIIKILSNGFYIVEVKCSKNEIWDLVERDWTIYLDRPEVKALIETPLSDFDLSLNNISITHALYPDYNGESITVSVKEEPFDHYDIDFSGRVNLDLAPQNPSRHATEMATIIAGAGNSDPKSIGVAFAAALRSSEFIELLPDNIDELNDLEVSLQNHSYGVGIENYYGIESFAYDLQVWEKPSLVHIFSAGNEGGKTPIEEKYSNIGDFANLTGQFKTSKNTLCIGASDRNGIVQQISSKGPTHDGRVKPELIAYGSNGSSEAAALTSGVVAVLQNTYKDLTGVLPSSSLIKAALINATFSNEKELSYASGYGNLDALKALEQFLNGTFSEYEIEDGNEVEIPLEVPTGTSKLNITLAWTDYPADLGAEKALTNDLDMILVEEENNNSWKPWVLNSYPHKDSVNLKPTRRRDTLNNVEKISINNPISGNYKIKIKGTRIPKGPQPFSIVFDYNRQARWLFPVQNTFLTADTETVVRWDYGSINGKGILQYKENNTVTDDWQIMADTINLKNGKFTWLTPKKPSAYQIRLVSKDSIIESGIFFVSPSLEPHVEFYCDSISTLSWSGLSEASSYSIYELGSKYMERVGTTIDTVYQFEHHDNNDKVIAVAPVIGTNEYNRSSSVNIGMQSGCYFQTLYSESPVSTRAKLVLLLLSNYDVKTITLERKIKDEFERIQEVENNGILEYKFLDEELKQGNYTYRVVLQTNSGKEYFSDSVVVFILENDTVILHPVPVQRGKSLEVTVPSESAIIMDIYDLTGRLIFSTEQSSAVKYLDTYKLSKGIYFLRIITEGKTQVKKFIVN